MMNVGAIILTVQIADDPRFETVIYMDASPGIWLGVWGQHLGLLSAGVAVPDQISARGGGSCKLGY